MIRNFETFTVAATGAASALLSPEARGFREKLEAIGFDENELRGHCWRDVDFSNQDLRGLDFSGSDLRGAIFRNALIEGASFSGCKLDDHSLLEAIDYSRWESTRTDKTVSYRNIDYGYYTEHVMHDLVKGMKTFPNGLTVTWGRDRNLKLFTNDFCQIGTVLSADFDIAGVQQINEDRFVAWGSGGILVFDRQLRKVPRIIAVTGGFGSKFPPIVLSEDVFICFPGSGSLIQCDQNGREIRKTNIRQFSVRGVFRVSSGELVIWGRREITVMTSDGRSVKRQATSKTPIHSMYEADHGLVSVNRSSKPEELVKWDLDLLSESESLCSPFKEGLATYYKLNDSRVLLRSHANEFALISSDLSILANLKAENMLGVVAVNGDGKFYAWDGKSNICLWNVETAEVKPIVSTGKLSSHARVCDNGYVVVSYSNRFGYFKLFDQFGGEVCEIDTVGLGDEFSSSMLPDGRIALWGKGPSIGLLG